LDSFTSKRPNDTPSSVTIYFGQDRKACSLEKLARPKGKYRVPTRNHPFLGAFASSTAPLQETTSWYETYAGGKADYYKNYMDKERCIRDISNTEFLAFCGQNHQDSARVS